MPRGQSLEERFWAKVVKGPGCWKWIGAKVQHGYGDIGIGKRGDGNVKAHVLSWRLHYGDIPHGMCVCHKCDNPECSNPEHLFLGTHRDNMLDKERKGRGNQKSKLTKRQVVEIICLDGLLPRKSLSNIFEVAESSLSRIVNGCQRKEQKCAG